MNDPTVTCIAIDHAEVDHINTGGPAFAQNC